MKRNDLAVLLLFLLPLWGCPDDSLGDCRDDILGCQDNSHAFPTSPVCTYEADLNVKFGHGIDDFTPISNVTSLPLEYGPQGGNHAFVAIQISGVDLEKSPLIKATLAFYDEGPSRVLTLGDESDLVADENGQITVPGIMIFNPIVFGSPGGAVKIEDMCGNTAVDLISGGGGTYDELTEEYFFAYEDQLKNEPNGESSDDGSIYDDEDFDGGFISY